MQNNIWEMFTCQQQRLLKDKLEEIADALNMPLFLKNIPDRKKYIIDYLLDQKGRSKR